MDGSTFEVAFSAPLTSEKFTHRPQPLSMGRKKKPGLQLHMLPLLLLLLSSIAPWLWHEIPLLILGIWFLLLHLQFVALSHAILVH
jgi:hypothetical protein